MSKTALRFDVLLKDGTREAVFDNGYCSIDANSFGEACFDAMMISDGKRCTLIMVSGGRDVKSWEISEGDNPDFDAPDFEAA